MNISLPVYPKLKNLEIDFISKTLISLVSWWKKKKSC
jgi:hypothetical protein